MHSSKIKTNDITPSEQFQKQVNKSWKVRTVKINGSTNRRKAEQLK